MSQKEKFNFFEKILKELVPKKIEVIPDDSEDKEIAEQMSILLNFMQIDKK